jgi:hypothetical protein
MDPKGKGMVVNDK